jgi:hypothetical protein
LYTDRKAHHYKIAAGLQVTQSEKRARTAAKTKATKEANKRKKQSTSTATGERVPDVELDEPETEDDDQGTSKRWRSEN